MRRLLGVGLAVSYPLLLAAWARHQAADSGVLRAVPVVVNLSLMAAFARSLLRGREPLITAFARLERGELGDDLRRYTYRLTVVWAVLFLVLAIESASLALYAPRATWFWATHAGNFVFVAALFFGEHAWRRVRFSALRHASPWHTLRVVVARGFAPQPRNP